MHILQTQKTYNPQETTPAEVFAAMVTKHIHSNFVLKEAIASEINSARIEGSRSAKISILNKLATKRPLPKTDKDWTPEYQRGWNSMQQKVKFELQRLSKLQANSKQSRKGVEI